jgi:hypothetical protein
MNTPSRFLSRYRRHQYQDEDGQPERERHDNEHRGQQGCVIGLASHQETKDGAGTGGQDQAPDKCRKACRLGEAVHLSLHHHPQVDGDNDHEADVQEDVPGKDRLEVVVGHGNDQPVRAAQVEYQYREAADQQGYRQQAGQSRQRLVGGLPENGTD